MPVVMGTLHSLKINGWFDRQIHETFVERCESLKRVMLLVTNMNHILQADSKCIFLEKRRNYNRRVSVLRTVLKREIVLLAGGVSMHLMRVTIGIPLNPLLF